MDFAPLPKGSVQLPKAQRLFHLYVNVSLPLLTVNRLVTFT